MIDISKTDLSRLVVFSDPGPSVEWGLGSQFCQPILLKTKCTGWNNGIIFHVGKILFILYENSD